MNQSIYLYPLLLIIALVHSQCNTPTPPTVQSSNTFISSNVSYPKEQPHFTDSVFKMRGLSFVAPPRPFAKAPMMDVKAVNSDWIAVIPYGFTKLNTASVHYEADGWKWWGERMVGVQTTIDSAHKAGLNVMLKPQVYVPGGWTGGLDFKTNEEWEQWEKSYENYLLPFVDLAEKTKVAVVCIGTEFKMGITKRESFWRGLIKKVRQKYRGKLVYAANWDEYEKVPFWDDLDYIGVNAYFPLVNKTTPSVSELQEAWKPIYESLEAFHKKYKKPIIFTEFGYLSVDGCTFNSWEIEKRVHETPLNEQAQANALDGLFATFWNAKWWVGGFLWKWFPEGQGHEGYFAKDYTPQGKKAEEVLKKWYKH